MEVKSHQLLYKAVFFNPMDFFLQEQNEHKCETQKFKGSGCFYLLNRYMDHAGILETSVARVLKHQP